MIADMGTEVEAARLLTLRAAVAQGPRASRSRTAASMAKVFASEVAMKAATKALQIHGGAGYITEFPIERMFRDAKLTEIGEGTSEIQRMVIARETCSGSGEGDDGRVRRVLYDGARRASAPSRSTGRAVLNAAQRLDLVPSLADAAERAAATPRCGVVVRKARGGRSRPAWTARRCRRGAIGEAFYRHWIRGLNALGGHGQARGRGAATATPSAAGSSSPSRATCGSPPATPSSGLGATEHGLIPDGSILRLARIVGLGRAKELDPAQRPHQRRGGARHGARQLGGRADRAGRPGDAGRSSSSALPHVPHRHRPRQAPAPRRRSTPIRAR